jgi:Nickel-containing superoxide dismutase.
MRKAITFIIPYLIGISSLSAHCQMPCGIYHDQMVYDKIDEYYETMFKGVSVLDDNKFDTLAEKTSSFVG